MTDSAAPPHTVTSFVAYSSQEEAWTEKEDSRENPAQLGPCASSVPRLLRRGRTLIYVADQHLSHRYGTQFTASAVDDGHQ